MSGIILSLYLIDARSSHPLFLAVIAKNVLRYCQLSLRAENHSRLRTNEDSLGHHSLLSACIYLDLHLLSFLFSTPCYSFRPENIFPLIIKPSFRFNFGLTCWCLCPNWTPTPLLKIQPVLRLQDPSWAWAFLICLFTRSAWVIKGRLCNSLGGKWSNFWWPQF